MQTMTRLGLTGLLGALVLMSSLALGQRSRRAGTTTDRVTGAQAPGALTMPPTAP
jgi:hypothetical protein